VTVEVRLLREHEATEAARQDAVSFSTTLNDELVEQFRGQIARAELWGAAEADRLLGYCRVTTADHWFGGRRVPCQHVASVAVPPEHRGHGVASTLMRIVAITGAENRLGLSLLFPSTTRLYRKLGWEHAGTFTKYRIAAWETAMSGPYLPAMRPAQGDADWVGITACYDRAAARSTALAVRPDEVWKRLRSATYQYVLDGESGCLDAYALFDHQKTPRDWRYTIVIRDWAATSAAGLRALVGFVASHGSFGRDATFHGGSPEPWSLLVGEQHVRADSGMFWMARGLDFAQAVAHRGFPSGLSAHTTVAIADPLLSNARGPWRLEITGGRGVLEPARAAEVCLDARAVGPLFTGFRDPAQLALAGLVSGPPSALATLGAAFAGPPPLLVDFF
jgi:predicted acetyltransferase